MMQQLLFIGDFYVTKLCCSSCGQGGTRLHGVNSVHLLLFNISKLLCEMMLNLKFIVTKVIQGNCMTQLPAVGS